MVLLDLFGRRWSLRILWELREASLTSRALRAACDEASPTVLHARLTELREAGFVALVPAAGYGLTRGPELLETFCRCIASPSAGASADGNGLGPLASFRSASQTRSSASGARRSESRRRHRQAGAVGLHDPDPAAGRRVGTGDAPDRVVDPHRAGAVDDRLFQREHPPDQRVGALVEERIALR